MNFRHISLLHLLPVLLPVLATVSSCTDERLQGSYEPQPLPDGIEGIAFVIPTSGWQPDQDVPDSRSTGEGLSPMDSAMAGVRTLMLTGEGAEPVPMTVTCERMAALSLSASASGDANDCVSRGVPITNKADILDFILNGFLSRGGKNYLYMDHVTANKETSQSGTTYFAPDKPYYWPEEDGDEMTFIALAPASEVKATKQLAMEHGGVYDIEDGVGFSYYVPSNPTDQNDVLFAKTEGLVCKDYATSLVPMNFEHLLTQVTFTINRNHLQPGKLKQIILEGISRSGTYSDAFEGHWNYNADDTTRFVIDKEVTVTEDGNGNVTLTPPTDSPLGPNDELNPGDYSLMMMPQNLSEDAKIILVYEDDEWVDVNNPSYHTETVNGVEVSTPYFTTEKRTRVMETSIAMGRWAKGEHWHYTIGVDAVTTPGFPVVVGPSDGCYVIVPVPVAASAGQQWTVTVSDATINVPASSSDYNKTYQDVAHLAPRTSGTTTDVDQSNLTGLSEYGQQGYWVEEDCHTTTTSGTPCETLSGTGPCNIYVYLEENLSGYTRNIPIILTGTMDFQEADGTITTKNVTATTIVRQVSAFDAGDFYVSRQDSKQEYIFGYDWTREVKWDMGTYNETEYGWNGAVPTPGYYTYQSGNTTYNRPNGSLRLFEMYSQFCAKSFYEWGVLGHYFSNPNVAYKNNTYSNALTGAMNAMVDGSEEIVFIKRNTEKPRPNGNTSDYPPHLNLRAHYTVLTRLAEYQNVEELDQQPASNGNYSGYWKNDYTGKWYPYNVNGDYHQFPGHWVNISTDANNGYVNTQSLYNLLGSTRMTVLAEFINEKIFTNLATTGLPSITMTTNFSWPANHKQQVTNEDNLPTVTAVRSALKMNKFVYRDVSWRVGDNFSWRYYTANGQTSAQGISCDDWNIMQKVIDLDGNDPKWYLPAPGQFKAMAEDWQEAPMKGTYWTSMPTGIGETESANVSAYYYDATDKEIKVSQAGTYNGTQRSARNIGRKIRVCRVKD